VLVSAATQTTDAWTIGTAIATMVAAVFGAVGAIAAWRAADASAKTSREAAEALANTVLPHVGVRTAYRPDEDRAAPARVVIRNFSPFAASDVAVSIRLRDQRIFDAPTRAWLTNREDDVIEVEIGQVEEEPVHFEVLALDHVRIQFSDERKLATYQRIEDFSDVTDLMVSPKVTETKIQPRVEPVRRPPAIWA